MPVAALAELVLANRIKLKQVDETTTSQTPIFRVAVIDQTPLGNSLLDFALTSLACLNKELGSINFADDQEWGKVFGKGRDSWRFVIQHLVSKRMLSETTTKGFFSLFTKRRYPIIAIKQQQELRNELSRIVRAGGPLSLRVSLLVLIAWQFTRGETETVYWDRAFVGDIKESQKLAAVEFARETELARLVGRMIDAATELDSDRVRSSTSSLGAG